MASYKAECLTHDYEGRLRPPSAYLFGLMPRDPDAARLRDQSSMLAEWVRKNARGQLPRLERTALVQAHCHHQSILGIEQEQKLLRDIGLSITPVDSGCCGLAGSFGYERAHHDVATACAERKLAPAVRSAPGDQLVISDGFSCRTQIAHHTDRRALHTAEVLQMAIQQGPLGPLAGRPEDGYGDVKLVVPARRRRRNAALAAIAVMGVIALVRSRRRRRRW